MISVIVPIYGVEKYIERCATSLFEQTYKDIEFIFVNDSTKDNSMKLLQNVMQKYPNRNTIIINKSRNEGLPQARKTGYLASHGEYIINFDSDDWVEKDCIALMYECAQKNGADIVMADYYEDYANKQVVKKIPNVTSTSECINMMLRAQLHSGVWNKLIRRDFFIGVNFPICNMHEDLVTMIQVFSKAKNVSCLHHSFYHYNLSNVSSLTQDGVSVAKTKGTFDNLRLIETFLKEHSIMSEHELAFANFVNTFKGAIMMKRETRNIRWLKGLFPQSQKYIFAECRLPFVKKSFLWGACHGMLFPYSVIDYLRKML